MLGRIRMFLTFGAAVMIMADYLPRSWLRHDLDPDLAIVCAAALCTVAIEIVIAVFLSAKNGTLNAPTAGQE